MGKRGTGLIFVYGTLRRGAPGERNVLLDRLGRFIGMASARGRLLDLGEYPGAVPSSDPGERVTGEVYELQDEDRALRLLDEYEVCTPDDPGSGLFRREQVEVELCGGGAVRAWIYFYSGDAGGAGVIGSGDYLKVRRSGTGD